MRSEQLTGRQRQNLTKMVGLPDGVCLTSSGENRKACEHLRDLGLAAYVGSRGGTTAQYRATPAGVAFINRQPDKEAV